MNQPEAICSAEDIDESAPWPKPAFARDGTCAHPEIDPLGNCRFCGSTFDEAAAYHRLEAEYHELGAT